MQLKSKAEAQKRADQIRQFQAELEIVEQEQVLNLDKTQRSALENYHSDLLKIIYQLAGFVFSATAIWVGIKTGWPEVVNTGNVFFTIFLYTKFYDWWWEWMPKYLFFFVIALTAILILLIFKRLRHSVVNNVREVTK